MNRAMIVSADPKAAAVIEQAAGTEGFGSVAVISAGSEARRLISGEFVPDMIVISTPLEDEFGQELAEAAAEETAAGIILICHSEIADELADRLSDHGVTVLARPVSKEELSRHIRLIRDTGDTRQDRGDTHYQQSKGSSDEVSQIHRTAGSPLHRKAGDEQPSDPPRSGRAHNLTVRKINGRAFPIR